MDESFDPISYLNLNDLTPTQQAALRPQLNLLIITFILQKFYETLSDSQLDYVVANPPSVATYAQLLQLITNLKSDFIPQLPNILTEYKLFFNQKINKQNG